MRYIGDMASLEAHRSFFAQLVAGQAGVTDGRLLEAFRSTPRERFAGDGPWKVFTRAGYVETPSDDPVFLYQDFAVALLPDRQINNGQPTLHAASIAALDPKQGETVVHIGAGTGYYTAILARMVGPEGVVHAYEIDPGLAEAASRNLADMPNVEVHARSGAERPIETSDAIYVSAGATGPLDVWLDALRSGGRLLFPLTAASAVGAMLLIARTAADRFDARFVCGAAFIPCAGARDEETEKKLAAAYQKGNLGAVRTLRRNTPPDETCWCAGNGWWLSTAAA
jgi:protein-L-isoaspartate(D-aspartate) O-methyltransferase